MKRDCGLGQKGVADDVGTFLIDKFEQSKKLEDTIDFWLDSQIIVRLVYRDPRLFLTFSYPSGFHRFIYDRSTRVFSRQVGAIISRQPQRDMACPVV
jgi:hypothetical protein